MRDAGIPTSEHDSKQDENYQMAHKYMDLYVDSLLREHKGREENDVLIQSLNSITTELKEIKGELAQLREQNAAINGYLDVTRLTIGYGQRRGGDRLEPELRQMLEQAMAEDESRSQAPERQTDAAEPPPGGEAPSAQSAAAQDGADGRVSASSPPPQEEAPARRASSRAARKAQAKAEAKAKAKAKTEAKAPAKKSERPRAASIASNVIFYLCMALLIIGAVAFAQSDNPEKSLFGYRYYYIKTASMEPVLPVGSVVITKAVPTEEIQVGDDITVYVGDGSSDSYLTHRVVELTTDQSGELAFLTKGVNNKANDPAPFNAKLVVGRVVSCIPKLGVVMTFVRSQLWLVIGIFVLLLALSFMLRLLFTKEQDPKTDEGPPAAEKTPGGGWALFSKKPQKQEIPPGSGKSANEKGEEEQRV